MVDLLQEQKYFLKQVDIQRISTIILKLMKQYPQCQSGVKNPSKKMFFILKPFSQMNQITTYWEFQIKSQLLKIKIQYVYILDKCKQFFNFIEQRMSIQINNLLKFINQIPNNQLKLIMNQSGSVMSVTQRLWKYFHKNQATFLKDLIIQLNSASKYNLRFIIPYLRIPYERLIKHKQSINQYKNTQKILMLKNNLEQIRINRQKSSLIKFDNQFDINKIKQLSQCFIVISCAIINQYNLLGRQSKYKAQYFVQNIEINSKQWDGEKLMPILMGNKILKEYQNHQSKKIESVHSIIEIKMYDYLVENTINQPQYQKQSLLNQKIQNQEKKILTGYLTLKKAKNHISSQNSYHNQIIFLKHIRNCKCPYIANYYIEEYGDLYIKTYPISFYEYLYKNIKGFCNISFKKKINLFYQLVEGVRFLSLEQFCHRDLKPGNIMISKQSIPKIIDFGSVSTIYKKLQSLVLKSKQLLGTQGYYYKYDDCDEKIKQLFKRSQYQQNLLFDSFSLGKIALQIFSNFQYSQQSRQHFISENMQYIVNRCIQINPDDRLTYQQIQVLLQLVNDCLRSI